MRQFNDSYVKRGMDGGREAAIDLGCLLKQRLGEQKMQSDWKLCVRIYLHMRGWTKTYRDAGILVDERSTREFVASFNRENSMFEIVDAGNDKEGADVKIKRKCCWRK